MTSPPGLPSPRSQWARALPALALAALAACERGPRPGLPEALPDGRPPAVSPDGNPNAPGAPAVERGGNAIVLSWAAPSDGATVDGYDVYRGATRIASAHEPRLWDRDARAGEHVCYSVVARAGGRRSPQSSPTCIVAPDVLEPSTPGALEASGAGPAAAKLRWAESKDDVGVTGYEVLEGEAVVARTRLVEQRIEGLTPGVEHCFRVRAVDAAGNLSQSAGPACLSLPPDHGAPSTPGGLAAAPQPGAVELRWSPSSDDVGVGGYEVLHAGAVVERTGATHVRVAGLAPGREACFQVVARDVTGKRSAPTAPACATPPDVTPPTVPASTTGREQGETIVLSWSHSTDDVGVARYEILQDGRVVARPEGPPATVGGLTPNVRVCLAVRACDGAGNCSKASGKFCATPLDATPPAPVARVSLAPEGDRRFAVSWTPTKDNVAVIGYEVLRDGQVIARLGPDAKVIADAGLAPATRYCYTVVAHDAVGLRSAPPTPACAIAPDLRPPTAPETLAAAARSSREIVLAWSPATDDLGVTGYEVVEGEQVLATSHALHGGVGGLAPETDHCLAVLALDAAGNRSPPSPVVCVRTPAPTVPVAPSALRIQPTGRGDLLLTWEPSPDPVTAYTVYWDGGGRGERPIGTTEVARFKVFGKPAQERHCYRVSAVAEERGESPRTLAVCGTAGSDSSVSATPARAALR